MPRQVRNWRYGRDLRRPGWQSLWYYSQQLQLGLAGPTARALEYRESVEFAQRIHERKTLRHQCTFN